MSKAEQTEPYWQILARQFQQHKAEVAAKAKKPKPKAKPLPNRRDMRAWKYSFPRNRERVSAVCGRCQKPFIAVIAERCMCPVAKPRKVA